jgi:hypothetical protein
MAVNWTYGDHWERFPVRRGEVWAAGEHRVTCADITITSPVQVLGTPDLIYTDPPWNQGNVASFYTKAGQKGGGCFTALREALMRVFQTAGIVWAEMGKLHIDDFISQMEQAGGKLTHRFACTYYRTKLVYLVRVSFLGGPDLPAGVAERIEGADDANTPGLVMAAETWARIIMDPCTGRGLTGRTAHKYGRRFIGSELNPRRLANLLSWYADQGLSPARL